MKRHAVRPLLLTISHLVLSACPLVAPPRLQPAEEVRARRAEGQAAHPQTLRARPHGGPQEGRADQTSGSIRRFTLTRTHTPKHYAYFVLSEEVDAVLYVFMRVTGADPPARHRGAHEPVSGTSLQGARRGRRHPGPSW